MMGKWTCVRSHGHCQHMAKDASPSLRWASSRHPPQHIVGPLTVKDRTPVEWILVLMYISCQGGPCHYHYDEVVVLVFQRKRSFA
ncbi:hypothetical protein AB1N83_010210 [Pleurotus pulmonarius]